MKKTRTFFCIANVLVGLAIFQSAHAQNGSPYWSMAGNNNANSLSKLGTTSADALQLYTNNTPRIYIAPDGKVGIGTNAPLTSFHVLGSGSFGNRVSTANATRALNLADTAAVMRILRISGANAPAVELISRTTADGSNVAYWDMYAEPSDKSFRIRDRVTGSNLDRFTINNSGRVGIGTTSPQQRLHMEGSLNQALFVNTSALDDSTSGAGLVCTAKALPTAADQRLGYILFGSRGGAQNNYNGTGIISYAAGAWTAGASQPSYLSFETTQAGSATRVERMRINSMGNIGIGTAHPNQKLHVVGNETLAGNLYFTNDQQSIQFANPSASPAPMMYMFASGTINTARMVIAHSSSFPTWGLQYTDNSDQFDFLGAGSSRMSINLSNGNVGIGVVSPVYRFEVCGTIRAKEVRVETGWCDYVFDKAYKLRPLEEVEKYINENQHLPGMAPASEVEKDGLKVGETSKAMMEKIEELTLYVIELSKENKKLQEQINALKK